MEPPLGERSESLWVSPRLCVRVCGRGVSPCLGHSLVPHKLWGMLENDKTDGTPPLALPSSQPPHKKKHPHPRTQKPQHSQWTCKYRQHGTVGQADKQDSGKKPLINPTAGSVLQEETRKGKKTERAAQQKHVVSSKTLLLPVRVRTGDWRARLTLAATCLSEKTEAVWQLSLCETCEVGLDRISVRHTLS